MRNRNAVERSTLVILEIDARGPIYLGRLGGLRSAQQGVRRIENAALYTERGARQVAGKYARAIVAPMLEARRS
jgi:hypothetical protein